MCLTLRATRKFNPDKLIKLAPFFCKEFAQTAKIFIVNFLRGSACLKRGLNALFIEPSTARQQHCFSMLARREGVAVAV